MRPGWRGIALALCLVGMPAAALQPPRPGEVEALKRAKRYEAQLERAKAIGNHQIDPFLLRRALTQGKRKLLEASGRTAAERDRLAPLLGPPPAWPP